MCTTQHVVRGACSLHLLHSWHVFFLVFSSSCSRAGVLHLAHSASLSFFSSRFLAFCSLSFACCGSRPCRPRTDLLPLPPPSLSAAAQYLALSTMWALKNFWKFGIWEAPVRTAALCSVVDTDARWVLHCNVCTVCAVCVKECMCGVDVPCGPPRGRVGASCSL